MRGHFVGKIVLNHLIGVRFMEIESDDGAEKGLFIPFKQNDIIQYGEEWQLWFRAFAFRSPQSRFSHFIMKFIPRKTIKKMSASQIEMFANHSIGGMIRTDADQIEKPEEIETEEYIQQNI